MAALVLYAGPVIHPFIFVAAVPTIMRMFSAFAPDLDHMLMVAAHGPSALAPGFSRFFGCELVRRAPGMSGHATLAGDLTLLVRRHGRKAPIVGALTLRLRLHCHSKNSSMPARYEGCTSRIIDCR